ncbi:BTAD domain-containing putative transcriptional regulator [Micromonosporaceae bacterium Da 78-11]
MDISVLGPLEVRGRTGETVTVAGSRLRTLLVLLALEAGRAVAADRLIDGVWGDEPPAAAGNALQALVSRLRRLTPELAVEATPYGYRLVIDADRVDAHRFVRLAAERPGEALELWRGELDFPEVARADAVRLRELRLAAQRRHLADQIGQRDVVPELEGLVAAHPLDEALVALLIRALRGIGSPGRALDVYETVRRRLSEQLGVDPSPELAALHLELLRAEPPAGKGNLPAEMSSFVGRDADVRLVGALLGTHRLVTLLGPGGSGKTRLSVEVGQRMTAGQHMQAGQQRTTGPAGTGEVWRVELAPVTDPAEVPHTILTALKLRGQVLLSRPGRGAAGESAPPLHRLQEALAGRDLLLILDNCEHLIAAAAEVADALLRAAPGLRLLATSREPLGLPGERLYPVEPLALPPVGADAATAAGFPAVRLLLDRAAGFTLDERNVEAVVRVCRALDGMPLAIELAAARLRTLPVAVLADRLADRFRLLTGGSRTALPRHQTLRAVVDWSWELVSEPERRLWRRFAVFHGGAEVTAAEQVCETDLELLGALVDKSLLVLGPDDRYRMLETIREYGLARLAEAGETAAQRMRLARYLLDLAGTAEPQLRAGPHAGHPALRLLGPLAGIFDNNGQVDGFALVEPLFDDPDPWLRAVSKMITAQLRLNFGQSPDVAAAELRESLAGFRAIGERWGIGFALSSLGDMSAARGDFAQAVRWQREAIALVDEVGIREDLPQLGVKLAHQLWLAGESDEAVRMLKQSRESAEDIGLPEVMASVEYGFATLARAQGRLDEAGSAVRRAAKLIDNSILVPQFRSMIRSTLGLIEAASGELVLAREHHAAAMRLAMESQDSPVIAQVLVGVADLALREGDPGRAAYLLGSADSVRGSVDRSVPDADRVAVEARAALGDAGFEVAYRRGDGVTMADAGTAGGLDEALT